MKFSPGKFKSLRCGRNLTQAQVADRAGVSTPAIQKYESGASVPKNGLIIERLAAALRCRVEEICEEENENVEQLNDMGGLVFSPRKFAHMRYVRGLTQKQCADKSKVSWQAIQKYETGASYPCKMIFVQRLAAALKCSVAEICEEENEVKEQAVEVANDAGRWLRLPICSMAQAAQIGTEEFPLANCLNDPEADCVAFSQARPGDTIVRVRGKSALPWFPAGTLLLVRLVQNLRNGDLVVAVLEGGEVVFKIFVATEKTIALLPIDPAGDNARFTFDRDGMSDAIRFYRVVQSMRDERALSTAMTAAGIAHEWEKELAAIKDAEGKENAPEQE